MGGARAATTDADLLEAVDKAATSEAERLRVATVAGELSGADAALARLEQSFTAPLLVEDAESLRTLYRQGADTLTPDRRERLLVRHEWFGQLALAYGKPADDALRRGAIRPAVRTVVSAIAAGFLALAAVVTGLVLLIVAAVDRSAGRLRPAYSPPPPEQPTVPFLEAFAAYITGMVVISTAAALLLQRSPAAIWFVVAIVPFAFFWPLLRGVGRRELREGLGWTRGRGVAREAIAGVVAYLAGLPVLAAGVAVSYLLQKLGHAEVTHPLMDEIGRGGWTRTVQLLLLASVWAPVVEETMFRGAFYHHLRQRLAWPFAAGIVSLLFAAVHPQGWAAIPALGAIGFCLCAAREWRGSIIAPAIAHALNNGAVTVLLVFMVG